MTTTVEIGKYEFDHGWWDSLIGLLEMQYESDEHGNDPTHLIATTRTGAGQLVYEFTAADKPYANQILNETLRHNAEQDEIARVA